MCVGALSAVAHVWRSEDNLQGRLYRTWGPNSGHYRTIFWTRTDLLHPTFLQGETSVRGEEAAPEWNEQLSFMELFPPLTRSLRLQLRDDAPLLDVALATHVLDLRQISNSGRAGEHDWPVWDTVCPGSH